MHRQNILAIILLILVSAVVVTAGYAKGWGPLGIIELSVRNLTSNPIVSSDTIVPNSKSPVAPEFAPGTWINSEPLTLQELRGRVVLIEFWTFGCYNCRNTLPSVKSWDARYHDKGLTVVGVHSPELENEKQLENVRREVASLGIRYPVVTDNDYATWKAYNVEAWPTIFLLDKDGRVRWSHVGEGAYDQTEQLIQKLLAEVNKQSPEKAGRTGESGDDK
jgi:thiol-disulfide isomerase/thioredoxin